MASRMLPEWTKNVPLKIKVVVSLFYCFSKIFQHIEKLLNRIQNRIYQWEDTYCQCDNCKIRRGGKIQNA